MYESILLGLLIIAYLAELTWNHGNVLGSRETGEEAYRLLNLPPSLFVHTSAADGFFLTEILIPTSCHVPNNGCCSDKWIVWDETLYPWHMSVKAGGTTFVHTTRAAPPSLGETGVFVRRQLDKQELETRHVSYVSACAQGPLTL